MDLQGRKIIVTGAASGIGRALIAALVEHDVKIVAADLRPEDCPVVPEKVFALRCDVSQQGDLDRLFEFANQTLGGADLCFSNAGFAYYETLGPPDWAHIARIFHTNVFASIYSLQKMRELNGDQPFKVVITASAMATLPIPGYALYAATKAALSAFAEAQRFELRDKSQVTLVYPIATRTDFFSQGIQKAPIPWPAQEPAEVARSILRGVARDQTRIFPYAMYRPLGFLYHLFPWIGRIYQHIQWRKFQRWALPVAAEPAEPRVSPPPPKKRPNRTP